MIVELIHQEDCKKNKIITDLQTGEIGCNTCGAVSSEKIVDRGPETFGMTSQDYQKGSRVGAKTTLKMIDMGLSTLIESRNKDATGRILSNENKRMFYRLRMWDKNGRYKSSSKSFQKGFPLLDAISAKLGLPESVIEQTAHLFRKIVTKKIIVGRSSTATMCAAIYITCRITNTPRTLQDIADAGNVKKKRLQKIYRFIVRNLEISPQTYDPKEFISRIARATNISEKTERLAVKILDEAQKRSISTSKNPMSMASAAIYVSSTINHEKVSQLKIAKISGVSAVTIRSVTNEIMNKIGGEVNG
jgi:transcription initiation factor TFIIB